MRWAGPRPWAGGTFLHHLPKHARTGPALPAWPLTQASRSQACSFPALNLLPHQFGTSLLARAEEMVSPGKKTLGNNKNSPPQTKLRKADYETPLQGSA